MCSACATAASSTDRQRRNRAVERSLKHGARGDTSQVPVRSGTHAANTPCAQRRSWQRRSVRTHVCAAAGLHDQSRPASHPIRRTAGSSSSIGGRGGGRLLRPSRRARAAAHSPTSPSALSGVDVLPRRAVGWAGRELGLEQRPGETGLGWRWQRKIAAARAAESSPASGLRAAGSSPPAGCDGERLRKRPDAPPPRHEVRGDWRAQCRGCRHGGSGGCGDGGGGGGGGGARVGRSEPETANSAASAAPSPSAVLLAVAEFAICRTSAPSGRREERPKPLPFCRPISAGPGGGGAKLHIYPAVDGGRPVSPESASPPPSLRRGDASPSRRFVSVAAIRLRRVAAIRSPSDGHGRPRTHTEAMLAGGTKPPPSRCPAEWFVRGPLLAGFAADRCPPTSSPSPANQRTQTERSPCVHFARPVVRSSSSLLCRCCPPSSPLPLAVENYPFWALPDWNEGRKKRNVQKKRMEKKEKIKKKTPPSPDPSSRLRAADSHSTVIRPSPFLPSSPPSSSPSPPSYPLRPSHRSLPLPRPHLPEIPTLLLRLLPQPVPASRIEQSQPGPLSSRILLCVQPRRRRHRREKKGKQKGRGEA